MKPWDGIVSEEDQKATYAAGFGRPGGVGKRPALLVIDVQYRTIGTKPMPFWDAIKEFPTSCGEAGWNAMRHPPADRRIPRLGARQGHADGVRLQRAAADRQVVPPALGARQRDLAAGTGADPRAASSRGRTPWSTSAATAPSSTRTASSRCASSTWTRSSSIGWSTSLAEPRPRSTPGSSASRPRWSSDLAMAHAWGGHAVEENQRWSLDFIAAMAKSRIATSDELMR